MKGNIWAEFVGLGKISQEESIDRKEEGIGQAQRQGDPERLGLQRRTCLGLDGGTAFEGEGSNGGCSEEEGGMNHAHAGCHREQDKMTERHGFDLAAWRMMVVLVQKPDFT